MSQQHRQVINLAFTLNKNYFHYLMVACKSLLENFNNDPNAPYDTINIYVIETDFEEAQKTQAKALLKKQGIDVQLHFVRFALQNRYPGARYKNIEIVTILYDLPRLIPDQSRVLFLDADMLFVGCIAQLWQQKLEHGWFAAVPCLINDDGLKVYNRTTNGHFWSHKDTINAGVILFDLDAMRQINASEILRQWTDTHFKTLRLPEQEALAFNFAGQREQIDHKWNWCGALGVAAPYWSLKPCKALDDYHQMQDIKVVHFPGDLRPDRYIINSRYFALWLKHYQSLNLDEPKPKPLNFMRFCFLMSKDKTRWNYRPWLRNILLLPLFGRCVFAFKRYLKAPQDFKFNHIR